MYEPRKVFEPHWKGRRLPEREYLGERWYRLRNRWLRSNPTCSDCGLAGEEVHHIIPRAVAPDLRFDVGNLCTLCRRCHHARHHGKTSQEKSSL